MAQMAQHNIIRAPWSAQCNHSGGARAVQNMREVSDPMNVVIVILWVLGLGLQASSRTAKIKQAHCRGDSL